VRLKAFENIRYFALGLIIPLKIFFAEMVPVTDPDGRIWMTGDIYQSMTLVTLFTMGFIVLVSVLLICRKTTSE